jgi:predicted DNA-binding transcriptional regulator YafY
MKNPTTTKTSRIHDLLIELSKEREITKKRAAQILGKKQLSDSTWKRYKRELAALGCPLRYDQKTKKLTVPKGWTLAPLSQMDPRKREILVRLRIDLLRMGSPFVETLGPLFEQWEAQLAGMDPSVKEQLPVWQPQPRVSAAFYENLSACERAIQERRVLGFTYKKSFDGSISARHIVPYDLFYNNGRIYVWGVEEGGERPKFFALDRMSDPHVLDEVTTRGFDAERKLDDTLRHSFGIFATSGKPRKVIVKIAPRRLADVLARRWPAEESVKELPGGWLQIVFRVTDPREVVAWVLSFGGDAKIIEPPEAAQMARQFAEAILEEHGWAKNVAVDERLIRFEWSDETI